jgi:subtilisin family serine protease
MQKYIIDFHNDVTQEQIDQYVAQYNGQVIKTWNNFEKIIEIESEQVPEKTQIVDSVQQDVDTAIDLLDHAQIGYNPDFGMEIVPGLPTVTFETDSDTEWWKNYVIKTPEFDEPTKTISRRGHNVNVYVMDSGIKADHPEFANTDISNVYTITPEDFTDQNGHGTAIASVISGQTCGMSSARIKVVKIFRPDRGTFLGEFLDALDAILADADPMQWNIINCSWSIPKNEWIENKLRHMILQNFVVVASAGNSGTSIGDVTPASMPETYTIGSYGPELVPSNFSNYTGGSSISYTGSDLNTGKLDFWAPGENIWAAALDGNYAYTAGTSMSAAIASMVFAFTLSDFTYDNGKKDPSVFMLSDSRNPINAFQLGHYDLLDLSDPKYTDSVNRIIAFKTLTDGDRSAWSTMTDQITWVIRPGSTSPTGARVFNPHVTKHVELIEPLPDNFRINNTGSLMGFPTPEQYPQSGQGYNKITSKVKVTLEDDYVEERSISIFIVTEDIQSGDYDLDQELQVKLASSLCSDFQTVQFCPAIGDGDPGCDDQCGVFTCCDELVKESECSCQG